VSSHAKIAVISSGLGWHVGDLLRAGDELGIAIELVSFRDLSAVVSGTARVLAGGFDLANADAVLVRTMPEGSLEQIVFRMDALHTLVRAGTRVVNTPYALETAIDKLQSLSRLAASGLEVPRTIVAERVADARAIFDTLGEDVVLKPIFGSEGRGIVRCTTIDGFRSELAKLADERRVAYAQEFVAHEGEDIRALVLGEEVVAAMRRVAPRGEWITNVACGGRAEAIELPDDLADLAVKAATLVGAEIAGVDLVRAADGRWLVLEVNAVPGWRMLAEVTEEDIAARVLDFVLDRVAAR